MKKYLVELVELPELYFMPNDLLEGMTLAVATHEMKPCHASSSDLEIYKLYDTDDNAFLGTCYTLKVGELFYANVQGSDKILCFNKHTFKMEKSDELWLPLDVYEDNVPFLVCKFEKFSDGYSIYPLSIKKAMKPKHTEISDIHVFDKKLSVLDALEYYEKNIRKQKP